MFDKNDLAALISMAESMSVDGDDQDMLVSEAMEAVDAAYVRTRDASLHALYNVLESRRRQTPLITKSELSAAYAKVAGLGRPDVVRESLGNIIDYGDQRQVPVRTAMLGNGTDLDIGSPESSKYASLWGQSQPRKFASVAGDTIKAELADFGVDADVALATQDDRFAVYVVDASIGPKTASFLVPAEIRNESILLPSTFFGEKLAEFNQENICQWVQDGGRTAVSAAGLLDRLNNALGPKVAAQDGGEWVVGIDGGAGVDLGHTNSPVLPNAEVSDTMPAVGREFGGAAFEQIFTEATAKCGLPAVQAAKRVVADGLRYAGVSFDPVTLEREGDQMLVIGTHVRTAAGRQYISVPVELRGSVALEPTIFTSKNAVREWTDSELQSVAKSGEVDFRAEASELSGAKFGSLYKAAMAAASVGNLQRSEELLSVILAQHGHEHYEQSLRDVMGVVSSGAEAARAAGDKYYDQLAKDGDEIAKYLAGRANLRDFGLID